MQTSKLRFETLNSPPIAIPDGQVYIRSRLVQLRFPNASGGFIWNRPVAIVVRTLDGQEKMIPVLDITRIILLILAGFCLTSMFILMFLRRRNPES
jgi:hypothetical protein